MNIPSSLGHPDPGGQTTPANPIPSVREVDAMLQVRARRGNRDGGHRGTSGTNPYLALLRTPGALAFTSSAFVGRISMSMYGLGTILLIASLTGRYGLAGIVA